MLRATERKPAASLVEFGILPLYLSAEGYERQLKGGGNIIGVPILTVRISYLSD